MSADSVSSDVFGAVCPTSTGAPGGGSASTLSPGPDSTTSIAPAGHQLTSDLSPVGGTHTTDGSPVHHSLPENVFNYVDQSGMPHGGVEASQGHHNYAGTSTPNDTGSGSGSVGHSHTGAK